MDHQTIFVSFILNSSDIACKPYPRDIMSWTESIYKPVFKDILGENTTSLGDKLPNFSLCENDYVINGLKIGGSAQTITKNRFVHHTSFLWDFCQDKMELLKVSKYRSKSMATSKQEFY